MGARSTSYCQRMALLQGKTAYDFVQTRVRINDNLLKLGRLNDRKDFSKI